MDSKENDGRNYAFSYLELRRAIGYLGVALPFVLALGLLIFHGEWIQTSISAYYHTPMGNVLTGTLCAIGFFLLSYRGYSHVDNLIANFACIFAIGTALFPSKLGENAGINWHAIFAGIFLAALIYFALVLFRKSDQPKPYPKPKQHRNAIYLTCGIIMSLCILSMGIVYGFDLENNSVIGPLNPVFWLESISVLSFGVCWVVKGEAIAFLND